MKIAALTDQIAKLGSFKATFGPIDFFHRAGPWLVGKGWRKSLKKWSVETRIMRDDQISVCDQGFQFRARDHLPCHHLIGDTGNARDLRWNRFRWFLQRTKSGADITNRAIICIAEGYRTDLDNFFLCGTQASGFRIDHNAKTRESKFVSIGHNRGRVESLQNPITTTVLEALYHFRFIHTGCLAGFGAGRAQFRLFSPVHCWRSKKVELMAHMFSPLGLCVLIK